MVRLNLGYPDEEFETAILKNDTLNSRTSTIRPVTDPAAVLSAIEKVRQVKVDESLDRYMVQVARATRTSPLIDLGLSPRGTLALRRVVQAYAYSFDRTYVVPDDIKAVAPPVMAHRMRLRGNFNGNGSPAADAVIMELVNQVPVPA